MARSEKGWKKFDTLSWEDGTEYPIRCSTETGEFMVKIPDPDSEWRNLASFQDKDLAKVKEEALAWLKDNAMLAWEAIIVIRGANKVGGYRHASEESVNLEYKRYYRGKRKDGSLLWKEFAKAGDKHLNLADKDDVEGQPGKPCHMPFGISLIQSEEGALVLPYSAERWSALRTISVLVRNLNERINALLDNGKMDDMLMSIAQRGAQALLPAPKVTVKVK